MYWWLPLTGRYNDIFWILDKILTFLLKTIIKVFIIFLGVRSATTGENVRLAENFGVHANYAKVK
jgi:hypothetical protein